MTQIRPTREQVEQCARHQLLDELMDGFTPCPDGNCLIRVEPIAGMHTNGGCQCWRNPRIQILLTRIQQHRQAICAAIRAAIPKDKE